jgi:hypothetical protein
MRGRDPRRFGPLTLLLTALAGLGGCASPAGPEAVVTPGSAQAQRPALAGPEVYLFGPKSTAYDVTNSPDSSRVEAVLVRTSSAPDDEGRWKVEMRRTAVDAPNDPGVVVQALTLWRDPQNRTKLVDLTNDEGRLIVFDPPLVYFPASLDPAKPHTDSTVATLRSARRPEEIVERGSADVTVEDLGSDAGGRRVIRTTLVIDLSGPTVRRVSIATVKPGEGIVGEIEQREVRYGLLRLSRAWTQLVMKPREFAPPPPAPVLPGR